MPSGGKRKKAAVAAKKKKKEQELSPTLTPSGSQTTSFNGGDDLKGKESDVGEVSSPASQDQIQSGGQSFTEEGGEDSAPVRQIDSEKVNEEVEVGIVKEDEDEGRVEITREFKLNEVSEGGGGNLSVEVGKNSDGSSSSSSSSSDEEEVHIEKTKTQVVLDSPEVVEVYEVVENDVDSQVTAVALEKLAQTVDESPVAAVVFERLVESPDDFQVPAVVLDEVVEAADESPVPAVVLEEVVEAADESQGPAVVLEELVYVPETALFEKVYEDLDKPALSELEATEDKALPVTLPTVLSHGETSNVDPFNVKDREDNVLPPSDSPIAVTHNGVGLHPKSPETQDSLDNQTPLLQAPLSVQRTTSWKGCCGLFEVFAGSR